MLCCLTVKKVQQCYITAEIHQHCYQRMKSFQFGCVKNRITQAFNISGLSVSLARFMKHYYAVVIFFFLFWPGRRPWHIENCENDQLRSVFSPENMHSVASLCCMTQKKHLLECGRNREAAECVFSTYFPQQKYRNHFLIFHFSLSHSKYCSVLPFHKTWNTTYEINL